VRQQIKGEAKILTSSYSAIHCCIQQWKNYENRSIFARVITKVNVSRFSMAHSVGNLLHDCPKLGGGVVAKNFPLGRPSW